MCMYDLVAALYVRHFVPVVRHVPLRLLMPVGLLCYDGVQVWLYSQVCAGGSTFQRTDLSHLLDQ